MESAILSLMVEKYLLSKMTKDEIIAIYKVLLKSVPVKRKNTTNVNKASAVIKQ